MQARYMDPVLGRFLSSDPVGFAEGGAGYFGRYHYAANDPVNAVDPDGNSPIRAAISAAKIVKRTVRHRGNVGKAVREEIADIVDTAATLGNADATGLEKAAAVANLAIGVKVFKGKCCFVAGTLVETEDGLRPIEGIEVGDLVWARNTETGATELKPVTELFTRHERVIWEVSLSGEDGEAEFFGTTDDHPWWIVGEDGSGRWVTTEDLAPGMVVVSRDADGPDGRMVLGSVTETDRTDATYNLTVADFHTYFVGEERVLVHNCLTGGTGRGGNRLKPDPNASGPHSTAKRDADGNVTGHAEWQPNDQNPTGFDQAKRIDVTGAPHTNKDGTSVPTPHVHEQGTKDVRPARDDELPN